MLLLYDKLQNHICFMTHGMIIACACRVSSRLHLEWEELVLGQKTLRER